MKEEKKFATSVYKLSKWLEWFEGRICLILASLSSDDSIRSYYTDKTAESFPHFWTSFWKKNSFQQEILYCENCLEHEKSSSESIMETVVDR